MPETRYARLGDDHIAYQTVGSGPRDILFMSEYRCPSGPGTGLSLGAEARGGRDLAGEILCSSTVRDLVTGSELDFVDRGRRQLRGVPLEWQIYAVK